MWTILSCLCLVVLVSAHLCSTLSEDTTTSDASLTLSTQPKMPAVTSIRTLPCSSSTELSTVSSQASTSSTFTVNPTQEITQCWPHKTSLCPENWYQVDNETCLLVITKKDNELPSDVCSDRGSKPVKRRDIDKLRSCLIRILGDSKGASSDDMIRVDRTYYVNVQSGTEATGEGNYSVICVSRIFKPPTVSLFSLIIDSKTGWSLVVNSTDYVTVNTTYAEVVLTCEADGVPEPSVIIKSESGAKFRSGLWSRLAVCSRAGVYTCTASNSLGTSQVHRRIHILSPLKVNFTANNSHRAEIRSGEIVELRCSVDGCPDRVTIIRNEHPIAETTNYTIPLVHEIPGVNCSHMGTYTCLSKSPTGQDVQETADLEVKGCPVSLCESEDASRQMSPILGGNVTFALCLMSSEGLKFSANDTKIVVNFTRNPVNGVYWTVNITMYNIQVKDYRTHTVRIANSYGSLDIEFTLKDGGPVSLCESKDASRKMSPILGGNVTFSLCLMSSEGLKSSANETKIVVEFTRNAITHVFWTVNITMYNIQVMDYRTYTIRIANIHGSLDVHFTLKDDDSVPTQVGQKAQEHESLLIALPPVCFIILVFTILSIVWYRVKGSRISRTRSQEIIDHSSGNDSVEAMYANLKDTAVGRVPVEQEDEHQQEADRLQCQEASYATDIHAKESGRFITEDGLVYMTVVNANKQINKRSQGGKHTSKHNCDDEGREEYITLDFEKTGKLLVADEKENKDDDS